MTHIRVREEKVGRLGKANMGVRGDQSKGLGMRSGRIGGESGKARRVAGLIYALRNQRPLHLAVSKPLQKNNKLWMLFDRHLCQIETGQRMHAQMNWGEIVELWKGGGGQRRAESEQSKQVLIFGENRPLRHNPPLSPL